MISLICKNGVIFLSLLYRRVNLSLLGSKYHKNFWNKFGPTYMLDPGDALFQLIGELFIKEYSKEFGGGDHVYNAGRPIHKYQSQNVYLCGALRLKSCGGP